MTDDLIDEKKEKKGYYTPDKSFDIASMCRKKVIENFANRNSNDMLAYYGSWLGKIEEYSEIFQSIKEKLESLMDNENTSLMKNNRIDIKTWWEYWKLLEKVGARIDYTGQITKKPIYNQNELMVINDPIYSYDIIFGGLIRELFSSGKDNCVVGSKGSGKSNYLLNLGFEAIKSEFPRYELVTNIGIKNLKHHKIHQCFWMSELLKIACENKRKNIELEKNGKSRYKNTLICILDEGENFIQALRSMSSENIDFNQFIQWTRKLDMSMTLIFHRMKDIPSNIINSPNLNAIIFKGIDEHGDLLPDTKGEAIIKFKGKNISIHINDIPVNPYLDTDFFSTFRIKDDSIPTKSVEIKEIFSLTGGILPEQIPGVITNYLEDIQTKNLDVNIITKIVTEVEKKTNKTIYACNSQTEYVTLVSKKFCETFKINDISEINNLKKVIEKISKEKYHLKHIEKRKKNVNIEIDYKEADLSDIEIFLNKNKTSKIKSMVNNDFRKCDEKEILYLLNKRISKKKLLVLYGTKQIIIDTMKWR